MKFVLEREYGAAAALDTAVQAPVGTLADFLFSIRLPLEGAVVQALIILVGA